MFGQLPGPHRWVLAGLILGGAAVAAAGAAMATTYGVWSLPRIERVEALAGEPLRAWIWGNVLLGVGVVVTAAGVASLAGIVGGAVARAGGALAVVAGTVAAVGFLFQGVGGAEAAELFLKAGDIPDGFSVLDRIQQGLLVLFGGVMSLATVAVGIGSSNVEFLPPGVGLTAVGASVVSLSLLPLNIPFLALLGALVLGVGLLVPGG